jgi:hypothetical protein
LKRWFVRAFLIILLLLVGCDAIPMHAVLPTLDVHLAIASTAAVELTRDAVEKAAQVSPTVTLEPPLPKEATPTPQMTSSPTPVENTPGPKNIGLLLGMVSMGEGSQLFSGEVFHVTWRIRNIGETVWNDQYNLVHVKGNNFGWAEKIPFSFEALPGDIVDVTLVLTAPTTRGMYAGEWLIEAPDGSLFGMELDGSEPLPVSVEVTGNPLTSPFRQILRLYVDYSTAEWRDQNGPALVSVDGNIGLHGYVTRDNYPLFEGGLQEDEPTIVMMPPRGDGAYLSGKFPAFVIEPSDYLVTRVGCLEPHKFCDATLKVLVQVEGEDEVEVLWETEKEYTGEWILIRRNLTRYAGKAVHFIFVVESKGNNVDDVIGWFVPAVYR